MAEERKGPDFEPEEGTGEQDGTVQNHTEISPTD